MKKIAYLLIALISLLTVLAIDEFKPGDRYYFSISNSSGGITGGTFVYNLTNMNMTSTLQNGDVTEFGNGIYYWNITTSGSTEPRVLQINGSYGTSNYLDMVDMIFIVSTRKTVQLEGMDDNFTNIETKVDAANTGIQSNRTAQDENLSQIITNQSNIKSAIDAANTGIESNKTYLEGNISTIRTEQTTGFDRILVNFSSVITNQSNIKSAIDAANTGIESNKTYLEGNISTIRTDIATLSTDMNNNFTRVNTNLTKISANLSTVLSRIGTPEGNSTNLWDYMFCSTTNFNSNTCLFYRMWVLYSWRTTSGIQT